MLKDSKITVEVECCDCAQTFTDTPVDLLGVTISATRCDSCIDKYHAATEANEQQAFQSKRNEVFRERCPKSMQWFDRERFPSDLQKHDDIVTAPMIDQGILIHGRTGSGKSRTLWQLAKRLITHDQRSVQILEDRAFGRLIERSFAGSNNAEHDKLIRQFQNCSVLMIDDIGKAKMTERVESDLFDIIDHRYADGKPMCFTTQFTGDPLISRFGCKETGEAIVRRIKEVTKMIYFQPINQQQ